MLESKAAELVEYKATIDTCLYLLWKLNRDADFSFLPLDVLRKKREKFLHRLNKVEKEAEEEVARLSSAPSALNSSTPKDRPASQDPPASHE